MAFLISFCVTQACLASWRSIVSGANPKSKSSIPIKSLVWRLQLCLVFILSFSLNIALLATLGHDSFRTTSVRNKGFHIHRKAVMTHPRLALPKTGSALALQALSGASSAAESAVAVAAAGRVGRVTGQARALFPGRFRLVPGPVMATGSQIRVGPRPGHTPWMHPATSCA